MAKFICLKGEFELRDGKANEMYLFKGEIDSKGRASGAGEATLLNKEQDSKQVLGTWLENKKHGLCKLSLLPDLTETRYHN